MRPHNEADEQPKKKKTTKPNTEKEAKKTVKKPPKAAKPQQLVLYDTNPFMPELVRNISHRTAQRVIGTGGQEILIRDKDRGLEEVGSVKFVKRDKVDDATFVKIFATNMKMLMSLTAPGMTSLMYLTFLLSDPKHMKKDHVRITWDMYQHHMQVLLKDQAKELTMSRPTFYRGVTDLVEKGALAPAQIEGEKRGWYFINPDVVINGDRLLMIQEYERARSEKLGEWRREQDPWVTEKVINEVPEYEASDSGFESE